MRLDLNSLLIARCSLLSFIPFRVTVGNVDVSSFYGHERHQSFLVGEGPNRALLLHGFPGTPGELRALGDWFAAHGFRVHAPLLPGFGMNILELGRTRYTAWVEAARAAWEALLEGLPEGATTVLVGFSMGGAVALHVAASTGAQPHQLVLIAPFWRMQDPRARWLPALQYAMPQLRPFQKADFSASTVRAQFKRLEPTLDLDDPVVQRTLKSQVALPTSSLVELQRLGAGAYRAAPRVTAPTLVVQGQKDATVAAADTRRLALRVGGPVTLIEIPGGHQLIAAHGREFGELCRRLAQHLPSSHES